MTITKQSILAGFISGLVYALIMAGFDYYEDKSFHVTTFFVNFLVLGVIMGVYTAFKLRRQAKKNDSDKN